MEREIAGRNRAVRPEQKSVSWIKDVVSKFKKIGHVVVNPYAGMFAAAKACMMLLQNRQSIGCEIDTRAATPSSIFL